jgi:hypothetical protein
LADRERAGIREHFVVVDGATSPQAVGIERPEDPAVVADAPGGRRTGPTIRCIVNRVAIIDVRFAVRTARQAVLAQGREEEER